MIVRAGREALDDGITDAAASLAFYAFLALPSALLLSLGLFGVVAGPDAVDSLIDRLGGVMPADAVSLLRDALTRVTENTSGSVALVAVGGALALWSATGAMGALMRALNRAYDRKETRSFVRQRLTALGMLALVVLAFGLSFGLLVLGPHLAGWIGDAVGLGSTLGWVWWTAQWPVLLAGLLAAFAGVLHLGPDVDHPRARFLTPGAGLAVLLWLAGSGLFGLYVSWFGSYNKAWGSLAAVVVMLTWMWLSGLALLLGAEVNAEAERSRELRRGEPAELHLQVPARS